MKILKRLSTTLIVIVMLISMTSCTDKSWIIKTDDTTVPIGIYIYYMSVAYSEAYSKVEDSSTDVLKQEIEGQNASDWIEEQALLSCKKLVEVEKRFNDRGLSFSEEELSTAESTTNSQWNKYGKAFEGFGISKESFNRASTLYSMRVSKLFDATYGEDGTQSVSDEELKDYFLNNYTNYKYFSKALTKQDENGDIVEMSQEEIQQVKNQFENYASQLNSGKSFDSVYAQYKSDNGITEDDSVSQIENLNNDSSLSDTLKEVLKGLENNKAASMEDDGNFYLLCKLNINSDLSRLDSEYGKYSVLVDMKYDDFIDDIKNSAESLDVTVNQSAINKYKPSLFKKS